jgi:hypothetical protein
MQTSIVVGTAGLLLVAGLPLAAGAHNCLREIEAPAGYVQDVPDSAGAIAADQAG